MSKVLVDRELLERIVNTNMADYAVIAYQHKEIRAILVQPAEAEGAVPVICYLRATPDGTPEWSEDCVCEDAVYPNYDGDETVSMPLVRQADHLSALSAVTAELDRLQQLEAAYNEWHDKTEWVQKTAKAHELGKHRADVLKERIDQLRAEVEMMREDAERWRYVSLQGDDTHWLNLLRVDLEDFGGNINAAVDALIDGDTPVTAAKEA